LFQLEVQVNTPEPNNSVNEEKSEDQARSKEDSAKTEECVVCHKTFSGINALREHMPEHLKKKNPFYECKHCGIKFADKSKLICHNVLNHNITSKPIQADQGIPCNKCDKIFKTTGEIICHQVLSHKKRK